MITIEQLQAHLQDAHSRIGHEGRFALTLEQQDRNGHCYITHWYRPTPYAFEDCRAVGSGTVEQCLVGLARYVATYRAKPGIDPAEVRILEEALA